MMIRRFKSGVSRYQSSFLPPRVEDYVSLDNPVRAIDAYVETLDVVQLGFRVPGSDGGAGQPPYHPKALTKLYLYGYRHGIRSSRRLEREAGRNLELIWLLKELKPKYRTIANFPQRKLGGTQSGEPGLRACGARTWSGGWGVCGHRWRVFRW
jgi:transposase